MEARLILSLSLSLILGANGAPPAIDSYRCSSECPVTGSPLLAYVPGKTYSYLYNGQSMIDMKGTKDAQADLVWNGQVDLTWISPCDVAVSFRDTAISGQSFAPSYLRLPMVVSLIDGRVEKVCVHEDDNIESINYKKGIASAIQNSLPSLSPIHKDMKYTETDVVGKCPTKYEVEEKGQTSIVTKTKDHRLCEERYLTPSELESPLSVLPLPLEESKSECKQEIKDGIYTLISCTDVNLLQPAFGMYKSIRARQASTLKYLKESTDMSVLRELSETKMKERTLHFDHETPKKERELVPEAERLITEICEKTRTHIEGDVASVVAKMVHIMKRVPQEELENIMKKVRQGTYCRDSKKLESIMLDAVAFVGEAGSVKIMVEQITSGHVDGGRKALYIAALHLVPRPCIHAVEAVLPLFEQSTKDSHVLLAASSMVHTYCRINTDCESKKPIRRIIESLGNRLDRQCSQSAREEDKHDALVTLKTIGNLGVMTPRVAEKTLSCIENESLDTHIRVAASHAFRKTNCSEPVTEKLIELTLDPKIESEVRMTSYLSAIECVERRHLKAIVSTISVEENTQVRSFILSHLSNLQETKTVGKERLRYLLENVLLPVDYEMDPRKFSRNVEKSFYLPSLGIGSGIESEIIYAPGSYIPRQVNLDMHMNILGSILDLVEIGGRVEGLEPMLEKILGPKSYLMKTPIPGIMEDVSEYSKKMGINILEQLQDVIRNKRLSIPIPTRKVDDTARGDKPRLDLWARILGQEVTFAALSGDLSQVRLEKLSELFFAKVQDLLEKSKGMDLNSARTLHLHQRYSLATIHGNAIKINLEGTVVFGVDMESNVDLLRTIRDPKNADNSIKLIPSISVQADVFVGFDGILKVGLQMENKASSAAGAAIRVNIKNGQQLEIKCDLPEKMELINLESQVYLVRKVDPSKDDIKVIPKTMKDVRIKRRDCSEIVKSALGLEICYNVDVPDMFRSSHFPLGEPSNIKLYIKKSENSITGYRLSASVEDKRDSKQMRIEFETVGSSKPRRGDIQLSYGLRADTYTLSADVKIADVDMIIETSLVNKPDNKSIEMFGKLVAGGTRMDISQAMRLEMDTKITDGEQRVLFRGYLSPHRKFSSTEELFEMKFSSIEKRFEKSIDVSCETKNDLAELLKLSIDVGFDVEYEPTAQLSSWIPIPTRLRKWEVECSVADLKVVNYVRKSRTSDVTEYNTLFQVKKGTTEMMSVTSSSAVRGRDTDNLDVNTKAGVKIGKYEVKGIYNLHLDVTKIETSAQLIRVRDNSRIIYTSLSYNTKSAITSIKTELDIPDLMKSCKLESSLKDVGDDKYDFEATIKYGESVIFEIEGPVLMKIDQDVTQQQVDFKIIGLPRGPHRVSTALIVTVTKKLLSIDIKNSQEVLLDIEYEHMEKSIDSCSSSLKLLLPSLVDAKINAEISADIMHVSINKVLLPKSSAARRVKGFLEIESRSRRVNGELYWDADRDMKKKISYETVYDVDVDAKRAAIHGFIDIVNRKYMYKTTVTLPTSMKLDSEVGVTFEVTTPSQQKLVFESKCIMASSSRHNKRIDARVYYKSLEGKEWECKGELDLETDEKPSKYHAKAKSVLRIPDLEESTAILDTIHDITEDGIRTFSANIEATIPSPIKGIALKIKKDADGTMDLTIAKERKTFVSYHYSKPDENSWKVRLETPLRTVEGIAKLSPTVASVKLWPRKDLTDDRYELHTQYLQHNDEPSGKRLHKYEARFMHPVLTKPMHVSTQYSELEGKRKGSFELDIFPDSKDKLVIDIETEKICEGSYRIDAKLSAQALKISPRITLSTAWTPSTKALDIKYKPTAEEQKVFTATCRYEDQTDDEASIHLLLETPQKRMLEVTGVISTEKEFECNGYKVRGVVDIGELGKHDALTRICTPAFIEISMKNQRTEKRHTLRLGVPSMRSMEVSLAEDEESIDEEDEEIMKRLEFPAEDNLPRDRQYNRNKRETQKHHGRPVKQETNSKLDEHSHHREPTTGRKGGHGWFDSRRYSRSQDSEEHDEGTEEKRVPVWYKYTKKGRAELKSHGISEDTKRDTEVRTLRDERNHHVETPNQDTEESHDSKWYKHTNKGRADLQRQRELEDTTGRPELDDEDNSRRLGKRLRDSKDPERDTDVRTFNLRTYESSDERNHRTENPDQETEESNVSKWYKHTNKGRAELQRQRELEATTRRQELDEDDNSRRSSKRFRDSEKYDDSDDSSKYIFKSSKERNSKTDERTEEKVETDPREWPVWYKYTRKGRAELARLNSLKDDDDFRIMSDRDISPTPSKRFEDIHMKRRATSFDKRNAQKTLILARIALTTPSLLEIEAAYDQNELERALENFIDSTEKVKDSCVTWGTELWRKLETDAQQKGSRLPVPELNKLLTVAKTDTLTMYQELRKHNVVPDLQKALQDLREPLTETVRVSVAFYQKVATLVKNWYDIYQEKVDQFTQYFVEKTLILLERVREDIIKGLNSMSYNDLLRYVEDLWQHCEESEMLRIPREVVHKIRQEYPEEYQMFIDFLKRLLSEVKDNYDNIWQRLEECPTTRKIIDWIVEQMEVEHRTPEEILSLVHHMLQNIIGFSVTVKDGKMNLQVPLDRRIHSLNELLHGVSMGIPKDMDDALWYYYNYVPERVTDFLPPFNATALLIGDTQILSFDGSVQRLLRTPCKVLLAKDDKTMVTVSYPTDNKPAEITLTKDSVKVVVSPERRCLINGRELTKPLDTSDEVSVLQSKRVIRITTPTMIVRILKDTGVVSVTISGWQFDKVFGAMGSYDGERGNDHCHDERCHDSPKELTQAWMVEKNCRSVQDNPVVSRISISRIAECRALLLRNSICSAVVPAESALLEMCYSAKNTCDVALAHTHLCSLKGLEEVVDDC